MKYFRKIIGTLHIVWYSMLSCFSTLVRTFAESNGGLSAALPADRRLFFAHDALPDRRRTPAVCAASGAGRRIGRFRGRGLTVRDK